MTNDLEMNEINRSFDDISEHETSSDLSDQQSDDLEMCRKKCACKRGCCCCSLSCWKMVITVKLVAILISGILFGGVYLLIELDIISFKAADKQSTTTTPTMNLSTTSMTRDTSLPSTSFSFTTYTTADQNSSFFIYNSTTDFNSSSIVPATSEKPSTTATTTSTPTTSATKTTSITSTTTTTSMPTTSTITTTSTPASVTTTTTFTTTTTSRTTTTTIPELCPPILPNPIQINNFLLLDNTTNFSNYTYYVLQFDTPVDATTALLVFEFHTKSGAWYLDDISVKRSDGLGSEIIRNGGFENGAFSFLWKYCYPPTPSLSPFVSQQFCHSGRYCFASRYFYNNNDYLAQNFNIESNTRYTIELYTYCKGESDLFNATISFQ